MTDTWAIAADLAVVEREDHVVVLRLDNLSAATAPLAIVDSALIIWRSIGSGSSSEEIIARVSEQVGVDADELAPQILDFLSSLESEGLAVRVA